MRLVSMNLSRNEYVFWVPASRISKDAVVRVGANVYRSTDGIFHTEMDGRKPRGRIIAADENGNVVIACDGA